MAELAENVAFRGLQPLLVQGLYLGGCEEASIELLTECLNIPVASSLEWLLDVSPARHIRLLLAFLPFIRHFVARPLAERPVVFGAVCQAASMAIARTSFHSQEKLRATMQRVREGSISLRQSLEFIDELCEAMVDSVAKWTPDMIEVLSSILTTNLSRDFVFLDALLAVTKSLVQRCRGSSQERWEKLVEALKPFIKVCRRKRKCESH
jgi:hypothetical protein